MPPRKICNLYVTNSSETNHQHEYNEDEDEDEMEEGKTEQKWAYAGVCHFLYCIQLILPAPNHTTEHSCFDSLSPSSSTLAISRLRNYYPCVLTATYIFDRIYVSISYLSNFSVLLLMLNLYRYYFIYG
jgi:hypothetical protein